MPSSRRSFRTCTQSSFILMLDYCVLHEKKKDLINVLNILSTPALKCS